MSPLLSEFVGTAILLLLGNAVVANVVLKETKGHNSGWIVITLGWGLAVFAAVFMMSNYGNAHLNPAVTVGFAVAGKFPWAEVPGYMLAQLLGAAVGTTLVWAQYRSHYDVTEDALAKRATFCTDPAIPHRFNNFLSELIGTYVLVLGVFLITGATVGEQEASLGSLDALPVGLLVTVIGISLGGTTGYAINPARDLGPRIMHAVLPISGKADHGWGYALIPILGPLAGAALAAWTFMLF